MKIVFIGAGNVATHLGMALKNAGHSIIQVYSRTASSAAKLSKKLSGKACTEVNKISKEGDLYIISVRDHIVKDILISFSINDQVIAHTSGSLSIDLFEKKFKHYGVIYPVQTFSINRTVDISTVPFCIEWNDKQAKKKIEGAVKSISKKVFPLNSTKRKQVHLAAVFANNFSNYLFTISENLLKDERLSFDLIRPLILETALKVQLDSPVLMQTGPAKRGDAEIISAHLKMLAGRKNLHEIYLLLSKNIEELYGIPL